MKTIGKKLIVASLLALCFAVCMCLFGACANTVKPEDNAVTYTVTVQIDESTPAEGVGVQICKGSAKFQKKTTGADGKAQFELAPDSYNIELSTLPAHYSVPEDANLSLTAESRDLVVTLEKNFAYIVKLVNPDGTAYYAEGVTVGICTITENGGTGNCLQPVLLEKGGVATIEGVEKTNYHVKVEGLPANAVVECDDEGYYTGESFSAENTEMTITVYPITSVNAATPMTDAEKAAFAQKTPQYTADSQLTAYHFEVELAKGAIAHYSITPEFDGEYMFYYTSGNSSNYLYNVTAFSHELAGNGIFSALPPIQAGKTYYFQVYNNGDKAATFEFVIEAPAASTTEISMVGDVEVTIAKQGAAATIRFLPSIGAAFKLTGPADINTSIILQPVGTTATHETYAKSAQCTARFTEERVGSSGILDFSVAVDGVSEYPVKFKVKVEKTADLKNTTTVKKTSETLTQYADQEGDLTYLAMDGTAVLEYNETDKFYHLGTADGPVVVVNLTQALASNRIKGNAGDVKLAYCDQIGYNYLSLILDTTADKNSLTKGNTYVDYRIMLRGFAEYDAIPNNQGGVDLRIPTDIKEEHYYAKYVNKDGVYPLTKELEAFLNDFVAVYSDKLPTNTVEGWLFACAYYAQETTPPPVDNDVIVGTYSDGDYTLTVNANGTFTIAEAMGSTNGTWEKNTDGTYKFIENNPTWGEIEYKVVRNDQTGALTFNDLEADPEEGPAYEFEVAGSEEGGEDDTDAIVGEYVSAVKGDSKTLTVNADGTYVIVENGHQLEGTWVKTPRGTYSFVYPTYGEGFAFFADFDSEAGTLSLYDLETDPDFPEYEFVMTEEE